MRLRLLTILICIGMFGFGAMVCAQDDTRAQAEEKEEFIIEEGEVSAAAEEKGQKELTDEEKER
ncbi:MAG: hypothetical protein HQ558_05845, partial [Candidatus Omnitrophica bacterium]|nr:hypothetical protein [Candidatus Omnitrophota bacterium]